jgi:hypothetical protein
VENDYFYECYISKLSSKLILVTHLHVDLPLKTQIGRVD